MQELTTYALELLKGGATIATGTAPDTPEGINMANSGMMLRWVATRGKGAPDWAIYCHLSHHGEQWIKDHGNKVRNEETIKRLVPCTDRAFKSYRY